MEVGNCARKGNLCHVFSYAFILMIVTISSGAIAESCPNITSLGAVAGNTSYAVANTGVINQGLVDYNCVAIPKGVFYVSVAAGGIIVSSGNTIKGINSESSMLIATDRVAGAIIKRNFPTKKSDYVTGVKVQDIGIILNQGFYNTQNPEMVGIDFSHISGSYISNVYVGTTPWGTASVPLYSGLQKSDLAQGIGIKLCTYAAGHPNYSGGERNVVEKARVWGARIGISIDDTRCLQSAAHGTIVRDSDIQAVEYGIAQQSDYTAGITLSGNTIQDLIAGGNNTNTMLAAYVLYGYTTSIQGGYIEAASTNLLKVLYLGNNAHGIKADLGYVSMRKSGAPVPLGQLIRMAGYKNQVNGYDQFVSGNWLNFSN